MNRMFYGLDGSSADKRMGGGHVQHVLISAATLWTGRRFKELRPPTFDSMFLDSGGFSFFYREGDYPFTPVQLADLTRSLGADYTAIMDYPCESETTRPPGLRTNAERIEATVRNTIACMQIRGPEWVPVVQGYSPEEYARCADLIESSRCVRGYMAIGSLCVRKKRDEAWDVIRLVRRRFPDVRLHGFGIDLRFLRDRRIRSQLWSADTQAWRWNNRAYGLGHKGVRAKNLTEKLENFPHYDARVRSILRVKEPPLETYAGPLA